MKKVICSIHDSKARAWLQPMFFLSNAQAMRSFSDACNDQNTDFFKHPEDYTLFQLGTFDEREGHLDTMTPEVLALAINLKQEDTQ